MKASTATPGLKMKIAVLSGKGGTGKTLVAVNLAAVALAATYVDCDVEEPNGHLFLKPEGVRVEDVTVKIPVVDGSLCTGCRDCVEFCRFNALAYIRDRLIIFEEICHSCGGCRLVCPTGAVTEKDKVVGVIRRGQSGNVRVHSGIMNIGEESGIPVINGLFGHEELNDSPLVIIDSPPGSSCNVMESIRDVDYCVLVAEPTLFGVHNLNMVYELVTVFKKPFGVVLNKCLEGENPAEDFCNEKGIEILARIPFDHDLGKLNSEARIAVRENEDYRRLFAALLGRLVELAEGGAA